MYHLYNKRENNVLKDELNKKLHITYLLKPVLSTSLHEDTPYFSISHFVTLSPSETKRQFK